MVILSNQRNSDIINQKNISFKGLNPREIVTTLANPDSLMTTIALESCVTAGRGYNAFQRGGEDELRERLIDDIVSAWFWMKGVDFFNSLGNKFGKKVLKLFNTTFDVGKDALRNPFDNLTGDIKSKFNSDTAKSMIRKLAIFKFTKIILSTLLSTSIIGFILPKINQAITAKLMQYKKMEKEINSSSDNYNDYLLTKCSFEEFSKKISSKNPSFKGTFIGNMTQISHNLENNTICKMLTNDAGIITGRTISARNKDEALEYLFRDITSLFFYFASTPIIYSLLQKITKSKGLTEIDPVSAKQIHENILQQLKGKNNTTIEMTGEEFKKKTLGIIKEDDRQLIKNLKFNSNVISLEELKKHITNKDIIKRAGEMAKLQPEKFGIGAVLTKQQVEDVFKNGSITQSEFMHNIYKKRFGEKIFDKYRYVSMNKITKFRENIDRYVESIIDIANHQNNGIVNTQLLERINKKSFKLAAGFRIAAMSISALALGIAIPKLQYALTEYRTGSKKAPMFRDYE